LGISQYESDRQFLEAADGPCHSAALVRDDKPQHCDLDRGAFWEREVFVEGFSSDLPHNMACMKALQTPRI
jgi:hypothetical protein